MYRGQWEHRRGWNERTESVLTRLFSSSLFPETSLFPIPLSLHPHSHTQVCLTQFPEPELAPGGSLSTDPSFAVIPKFYFENYFVLLPDPWPICTRSPGLSQSRSQPDRPSVPGFVTSQQCRSWNLVTTVSLTVERMQEREEKWKMREVGGEKGKSPHFFILPHSSDDHQRTKLLLLTVCSEGKEMGEGEWQALNTCYMTAPGGWVLRSV